MLTTADANTPQPWHQLKIYVSDDSKKCVEWEPGEGTLSLESMALVWPLSTALLLDIKELFSEVRAL